MKTAPVGGQRGGSAARLPAAFLVLGSVAVVGYYLTPARPQLVFYELFSVAGLAAAVAGLVMHRPRPRLPWLLVVAFFACQVTGDTVNNLYVFVGDREPPYPSPADALYLVGYAALIAAGVVLGRFRKERSIGALMDAAVIAVAVALPVTVFLIEPLASTNGTGLAEQLTIVAYALFDVLMVGVVARLAISSLRRVPAIRLLLLSVVILLCTDVLLGLQELNNAYVDGGWIDSGWMIAYLVAGAAVLHPSIRATGRPEMGHLEPLHPVRLIALTSAALVVPAVLIPGEGLHHLPVVIAGAAIIALIIARLAIERRRFDAFATAVKEHRIVEEQLRQAQKMDALGRLAGGISHDFNNLLTAITGYTELIADALPADSSAAGDAIELRRIVERATAVTRQLLTLSGRQLTEPADIDVAELVTELEPVLRTALGDPIALTINPGPAGCNVRIDRTQLERALLNLVINARDAMPAGGSLTIEISETSSAGDARPQVVISVIDTGDGIDPTVKEHIFEPFFTTKPRGSGTGLGLATAYAVVHENGGTIDVESSPGNGARFDLTLPLTPRQPDVPSAPGAQALDRGRPNPASRRILLAEDEEAVRTLIAAHLRSRGHAVTVASNGREAVTAAFTDDTAPDLFLSDVAMPHLDGPGAALQLRARWPHLPVLFLSGYVEDGQNEERIHALGARVVPKPFRLGQLLVAVETTCERPTAADDMRVPIPGNGQLPLAP